MSEKREVAWWVVPWLEAVVAFEPCDYSGPARRVMFPRASPLALLDEPSPLARGLSVARLDAYPVRWGMHGPTICVYVAHDDLQRLDRAIAMAGLASRLINFIAETVAQRASVTT